MARNSFDSHALQTIGISSSSKSHWTVHSMNSFQLNGEERKNNFVIFLGKRWKFQKLNVNKWVMTLAEATRILPETIYGKSVFANQIFDAVNKNMNVNIMSIQTHFETTTSDCSAWMFEIERFLRLAKTIEKCVEREREMYWSKENVDLIHTNLKQKKKNKITNNILMNQ